MLLGYAAPEVRRFARYGVRSEVYSLGVTLVELLTGVHPFTRGAEETEDGFQMRWDAAALPTGLPLGPPALGALLSRMLAVDPDDRPEGPGEIAAELRGIQVELGRALTPPTPHVRRRTEEVLAPRFPPDDTLAPPAVAPEEVPVEQASSGLSRRRFAVLAGVATVALGGGAWGLSRWTAGTGTPPAPVLPVRTIPLVSVGLHLPWGLALDHDGSALLVADSDHLVVWRRQLDGTAVEVVAGGQADAAPGSARAVQFRYPCGLAFRRGGSFYVADSVDQRVRLVQLDGSATVVAGTGVPGRSPEGAPGPESMLRGPHGLAVSDNGDLYIADTDNHRLCKLDTDGRLTTVAGTGRADGPLGDGHSALDATLYGPEGVALAVDGATVVTQWKANRIRRIDPSGRIDTLAGTGVAGYDGDGVAARTVRVNGPGGPSFLPSGDLVFSDMNNNRVRTVTTDGTLSTLAGSGQRGTSVPGAVAVDASLANPIGTAVGPDGGVFFLELNNSRVSRIRSDAILDVVMQ